MATGVLEAVYEGSGHLTCMAKFGGLLVGVEGSSVRTGGTNDTAIRRHDRRVAQGAET
jgi:hypothetical protein